jgi:hypothetical protein
MKCEAEADINIPLSIVHKRVTIAIGVLERTLCYIVKEGKNVDVGALATFTSPGKSRPRKCTKSEVYSLENCI